MRLISCAVDAVGTAEPTWAAAAAASSSAIQDDRHTDRNQIVRQVTKSSFAELWISVHWYLDDCFWQLP